MEKEGNFADFFIRLKSLKFADNEKMKLKIREFSILAKREGCRNGQQLWDKLERGYYTKSAIAPHVVQGSYDAISEHERLERGYFTRRATATNVGKDSYNATSEHEKLEQSYGAYELLSQGHQIGYDMVRKLYNAFGAYIVSRIIDFEEETLNGFKGKFIQIGETLF